MTDVFMTVSPTRLLASFIAHIAGWPQ